MAEGGFEYVLKLIDKVSEPAKKALGHVEKLTRGFTDLVPGASGAVKAIASVGESAAGVGGPIGLAAIATVGLVAGFAAVTAGLAAMSIEAVSARERLTATFDALGTGPEAGERTIAMLDSLRETLPATRRELADTAKSFMAMGVTDLSQLRAQIIATQSATAIMGKEGGAAYEKLQQRIIAAQNAHVGLKLASNSLARTMTETGVHVSDVAARMGVTTQQLTLQLKAGTVNATKFGNALQDAVIAKGAKPLAAMGMEVGVMWDKAKESFSELLEGTDPKPLTSAMGQLLGIISQATPSGQAMRFALTGALNAVFVVAGKVFDFLRHFFLQLIIWGLKAYIALKPAIRGFEEFAAKVGLAEKVTAALKGAFYAVVAVFAIGAAVVGAMVTAVLSIAAALTYVIGAIIRFVPKAIGALTEWAKSGWTIAGDFISGLVDGIRSGATRAVEAVKGLGKDVLGGVKAVLGIASPSVEMTKVAHQTVAGFTIGVDREAPKARESLGALVAPPSAPMAPGRPGAPGAPGQAGEGGRGGRGGGGKVEVHLHVHGTDRPQDVADIALAKLVDMLETLDLQMGGATTSS